jgi:hypothetical protein
MRMRGRIGEKWKELRGGITIRHHLFVSTPYNYEFANDGKVI